MNVGVDSATSGRTELNEVQDENGNPQSPPRHSYTFRNDRRQGLMPSEQLSSSGAIVNSVLATSSRISTLNPGQHDNWNDMVRGGDLMRNDVVFKFLFEMKFEMQLCCG